MITDFVGGRPKVVGLNALREWKNIRICLCPGGKHVPPPRDWIWNVDEEHNPLEPTWCTVCPLNMWQCVQDLLPDGDKGRSYPKWLPKQQRYSDRDYGWERLIPVAQEWIDEQGGNPDDLTFCPNSGRKSLGKWCAELQVKYSDSHQIHGDLWSTWQRHYQRTLPREPAFTDREQSQNMDELTAAHRKFARYLGRGREARGDPTGFSPDQLGKLMCATLREMGKGDLLSRILDRL